MPVTRVFSPSHPMIFVRRSHFFRVLWRFLTIVGQSLSEDVRIWWSYLKDGTEVSKRPYASKSCPVLSSSSSVAILYYLYYAPISHCTVLVCHPFKSSQGTNMFHWVHFGWGIFICSIMITVYCIFWIRKFTWIPVLIFALHLHPSTVQSCVPTALGK